MVARTAHLPTGDPSTIPVALSVDAHALLDHTGIPGVGGGGGGTLAQTLVLGNTTGPNDISVDSGQQLGGLGNLALQGYGRIGTVTDPIAQGDFGAGLAGGNRMFFDQSEARLAVRRPSNGFATVDAQSDSGAVGSSYVNVSADVDLGAAGLGGNFFATSATYAGPTAIYDLPAAAIINSSLNATNGLIFNTFGNAPMRWFTNTGSGGGLRMLMPAAGGLNVGTTTDASANGDLSAGLTGAGRWVYDQGTGVWSFYSLAGAATFSLNQNLSLNTAAQEIIAAINEVDAAAGGAGGESLAQTLAIGNTTGANDIAISSTRQISGGRANFGTVTSAIADGDFAAGLAGSNRVFYDASAHTFFVDDPGGGDFIVRAADAVGGSGAGSSMTFTAGDTPDIDSGGFLTFNAGNGYTAGAIAFNAFAGGPGGDGDITLTSPYIVLNAIAGGGFGTALQIDIGTQNNPTINIGDTTSAINMGGHANVGTVTDAIAQGDFAAGLAGSNRMFWDQSGGSLALIDAAGTRVLLENAARFRIFSPGTSDVLHVQDEAGSLTANGPNHFTVTGSTPPYDGRFIWNAITSTLALDSGPSGSTATWFQVGDPGWCRVGSTTDAIAAGDFAAGLTGGNRIFFDQSSGAFFVYETSVNPNGRVRLGDPSQSIAAVRYAAATTGTFLSTSFDIRSTTAAAAGFAGVNAYRLDGLNANQLVWGTDSAGAVKDTFYEWNVSRNDGTSLHTVMRLGNAGGAGTNRRFELLGADGALNSSTLRCYIDPVTGIMALGSTPRFIADGEIGFARVGTTTDAAAAGDFSAGLTGAQRMTWNTSTQALTLYNSGGAAVHQFTDTAMGLFGTAAATQQTVTGSRGGNAALANLLTALAAYGLIVDSTTA